MKASNKILTIYAILTPLIIAGGFIVTHDFSIDSRLRIKYTHPATWEHFSDALPEDDYSVISGNYTGIIFSDTIPPGSLGFRFVNPKLKPSYYVKNDTLFLWSHYTYNHGFYHAYFFLHPSERIKLEANTSLVTGNFNSVKEIQASIKSSRFKMASGHVQKVLMDTATNSQIIVVADTVDGFFKNSQIQLNDFGKFIGTINEKSNLTISKNPFLESMRPPELFDNTWDINLYFMNNIIPINLSDSLYKVQIPPQ